MNIYYLAIIHNSTLDEVIKDKDEEKKRLDEEEQEFMVRRRERGRKIIQIEKEELARRESEVSSRYFILRIMYL